jgi:hypothetical protein
MPTPRPPTSRFFGDRSAQSETLAVLLLVALTVVGGGTVLVFGASAIDDATSSADIGKAEHAMTQLDSKTSLVAHGTSETQRVDLGGSGRGTAGVDESAGRMTVRIINGTDGNTTILDRRLGAVTYERGQTTLAYQGGGVWRRDGNGSTMVSPPEFHYERGTLTLPLVRVESDGITGRSVRIVQQGETDGRYPNETLSNPLTKGRVEVAVRSDYYQAWGTYFEDRTSGDVAYDHANETATIELVTPFDEEFDNVLATTDGNIEPKGNGDVPSPSESGVNYPSADPGIESRIDDCLDGSCKSWSAGSDITDSGTYYTESDVSGSFDIDTSGGDVDLVVNGSFKPDEVTVSGTNNATVYVKGDVTFGKGNEGGDPKQFRVMVHSSGSVEMKGSAVFVGLLYAPESAIELRGSGLIEGGVVGESITIRGNPANNFKHNETVENVGVDVGGGGPTVLYLHVSVTTVEIEDG